MLRQQVSYRTMPALQTCASREEWHRLWKSNFPNEWQEIFLPDEQTGENHIADVRTVHGLVLEFQHSHIHPKERDSREKFYKDMIWVVDGTRLKQDYPRFLKGKDHFQFVKKGIHRLDFPEDYFPAAWLNSSVPVIFDFRRTETLSDPGNTRNSLYCLLPVRVGTSVIIAEISRSAFVNTVINGTWSERVLHFMRDLTQVKQEWQDQMTMVRRMHASGFFSKINRLTRFGRSRRF